MHVDTKDSETRDAQISRRQLMRAGATLPAVVWAAPVVTLLRPAAALPGSVVTEPSENPTLVPRTPPSEEPTDGPQPRPNPEPTEVGPTEPGDSETPVPPTGTLPPGPGPGGLHELPATGIDAATLAALGSASVAAGAAIVARSKRHAQDRDTSSD